MKINIFLKYLKAIFRFAVPPFLYPKSKTAIHLLPTSIRNWWRCSGQLRESRQNRNSDRISAISGDTRAPAICKLVCYMLSGYYYHCGEERLTEGLVSWTKKEFQWPLFRVLGSIFVHLAAVSPWRLLLILPLPEQSGCRPLPRAPHSPTQPHTAPHSPNTSPHVPTQPHTAPHGQLSLLLTEPLALAHHPPQKSSAHPLIWFFYSCQAWVAEFWKVHSKCWHSTQSQDFVADFSGPPELWSCFSRVIISLVLRQQ